MDNFFGNPVAVVQENPLDGVKLADLTPKRIREIAERCIAEWNIDESRSVFKNYWVYGDIRWNDNWEIYIDGFYILPYSLHRGCILARVPAPDAPETVYDAILQALKAECEDALNTAIIELYDSD